jgi:hypothetical protein
MPNHVCMGATLGCTMAMGGTSSLIVVKPHMSLTDNKLAANIMDHLPFANIPPFPICQAPANPTVIAATAAALGTPTPAACVPNTPAPWVTGSVTVILDNMPALNKSAQLVCIWGGLITVKIEGQATHQIP